ncbi:uncharacterized protein LOC131316092 isoform X2 [Rhododendron vialii]|uniref:uncharacterized protein LOC131316092 isoform X2 n=1 Tax=Rhododendron vialii TaxID=182163 RepID=UPI00265E4EA9|nr:uncharacterized protein LOC131316092 isoform X2 [Rhododendron vialii]
MQMCPSGFSRWSEFNIEKLQLVEAEKKKIRQEYERKEKQVEVRRKCNHFSASYSFPYYMHVYLYVTVDLLFVVAMHFVECHFIIRAVKETKEVTSALLVFGSLKFLLHK